MRVPDWHRRLSKVFESAHGRHFRWGHHDCCQFAARVVKAISGDDRRKIFPTYRNKAEALALLAEHGGMRGLMVHALGEPNIDRALAGDGDIVLVDFGYGQGEQPAVCRGVYAYAPGRTLLHKVETLKASAAWKI